MRFSSRVMGANSWAWAPTCSTPDPTFSWFPGWTWQIAECAACREHMGWIYRCAGEQFHGLVLARLVDGRGRTS